MTTYPARSSQEDLADAKRYPTSADLAVFRRSIAYNTDGQTHATSLAFGYVPEFTLPSGRRVAVAHPYERQHGIGYRMRKLPSPQWNEDPWNDRAGRAIREAAAMRSRAYARLTGSLVLSSWSCYHCDQSHRHMIDCPWNVERNPFVPRSV